MHNRPGHYLKPGEDEKGGLKEILNLRLGPEDSTEWNSKEDWVIGEKLSTWWRPNYETYVVGKVEFKGLCLIEGLS